MRRSRWHFSLVLLAIYLAIFHVWFVLNPRWIPISGLAVSFALGLLFGQARASGYFANLWDQLFHLAVVADILIEALLIKKHDHFGFYLCAIAFVLFVGGYRFLKLRSHPNVTPNPLK